MAKSHLDSGSCIRHSYSHTDEALRIIPSSNTSFAIELDATDGDSVQMQRMAVESDSWMNVSDPSSSETSPAVDITHYAGFAIQINATDLNASDATLMLEVSIDGENYAATATGVTMANGTSTRMINISDAHYKYFRLAYNPGSNTAGTISAEYMMKG